MAGEIDGNALVSSMYRNKASMENEAKDARTLVDLGLFSIPNKFLFVNLRTDAQEAAQTAPQDYMKAMQEFLKKMSEILDKTIEQR